MVSLKLAAQYCMDSFYGDYKTDRQFYVLEDFIVNLGNSISELFQKRYDEKYLELLKLGLSNSEIVSFDSGLLSTQILDVTKKYNNVYTAKLDKPVMSFFTDNNSVGIQDIQVVEPSYTSTEIVSQNSIDKLKYLPKTNKIFVSKSIDTITLYSNCGTIKKIVVNYIPSVSEDAELSDGLVAMASEITVKRMRAFSDTNVIDMTNNQNNNKVIETEIDK